MSSELENRTKAALKQFDNNMAGIFDRKSFYEGQTGGSQTSSSERTRQASQPATVMHACIRNAQLRAIRCR